MNSPISKTMKSILHIKNMVCPRCLMAVEAILQNATIPFHSVELGKVELKGGISKEKLTLLDSELSELGFELLVEENEVLTNSVKSFVIEFLYSPKLESNQNFSDLLSKSIGKDYSTIVFIDKKYLWKLEIGRFCEHCQLLMQKLCQYSLISRVFSQTEGTTIEKFIIKQRIERAKELLSYGKLNLSEIAYQLNYSSSSYLSNQFKKIMGISPSKYVKQASKNRKMIDQV